MVFNGRFLIEIKNHVTLSNPLFPQTTLVLSPSIRSTLSVHFGVNNVFPFCIAQEGNGFRFLMAVFANSVPLCLPYTIYKVYALVTGRECVI